MRTMSKIFDNIELKLLQGGYTRYCPRPRLTRSVSGYEISDWGVSRVGVTQAYIAMLGKGNNVNPTLALLTKLAKALKVRVAELAD